MFGSKKKPKGPFTLPIAIGREKIDDVTVTIVSALPASFVISEILRRADEEYHVIGLEKFDKEVERWTKLKNDDDISRHAQRHRQLYGPSPPLCGPPCRPCSQLPASTTLRTHPPRWCRRVVRARGRVGRLGAHLQEPNAGLVG